MILGKDLPTTELPEMFVKREGFSNAHSIHDDFAGAVSQAPSFVNELLE
ncbi:MAG: hypothetical protein KDB27_15795 [Planctomycetales bacterium]|nr:hypothetical protein [Planctomycetales bacterium]